MRAKNALAIGNPGSALGAGDIAQRWGEISFWILLFLMATAAQTWAATPVGTVISNTARVDYAVNGVNGNPLQSNTHQFAVEASGWSDKASLLLAWNPENSEPSVGDSLDVVVSVRNIGDNALVNGSVYLQLPTGFQLRVGSTVQTPVVVVPPEVSVAEGHALYSFGLSDIQSQQQTQFSATLTILRDTLPVSYSVGFEYLANNKNITAQNTTLNVKGRTSGTLELLRYDAANSAGSSVIGETLYFDGNNFVPLTVPLKSEVNGSSVVSKVLPLANASTVSHGEIVFLRVTDLDRNIAPAARDTVVVGLKVDATGDEELLKLQETEPSSGVFTGYAVFSVASGGANDGQINVIAQSQVVVSYSDEVDEAGYLESSLLVDPYGKVFDSVTGDPLNGFYVHLLDADTGNPAQVTGDDGISSFPATVVTGATATDSSGHIYTFAPGTFRFPFVATGNYRLVVVPPERLRYLFPSQRTNAELNGVPNGPFVIDIGSRGEPFAINSSTPLHLDIPVDAMQSSLFVQRQANKQSVSAGEFIQFRVRITNTATSVTDNVVLSDQLPTGIRYRDGTLHINGASAAEPVIGADGRTLDISVGEIAEEATAEITYIAEIGAMAARAVESSSAAQGDFGLTRVTSNVSRVETVVSDVFMRTDNIVTGRVILVEENGISTGMGLSGVRIYLEDGRFAITDENGRFHFEGVKKGTHVVQLDVATVSEKYNAVAYEPDDQFAGRPWSKFVDLSGGGLWNVDFYVSHKPKQEEKIRLQINHHESKANNLQYEFLVKSDVLPLRGVRAMVMLPQGVRYIAGSSLIDGEPTADPEVMDDVLIVPLGEMPAGEQRILTISTEIGQASALLVTKAILLFDTPERTGQRAGTLDQHLTLNAGAERGNHVQRDLNGEADSTVQIPTVLNDPEKEAGATDPNEDNEGAAAFDETWLKTAPGGVEWLYPAEGYLPKIPSLKIGIKHSRSQAVSLYLNGYPVPDVNKDETRSDSEMYITRWSGVDLYDGDNKFEAVIKNQSGIELQRLSKVFHYSTQPDRVELLADESLLIADGVTPLRLVFKLFDKDGYPVRRGSVGEFRVNAPYRPLSSYLEPQVLPGAPQERFTFEVERDGRARVQLHPTGESGELRLVLPLGKEDIVLKSYVRAPVRDWVVVGFAEGTAGYRTISGNTEVLDGEGDDDKLYTEGKLAFFAKGRIKGEWLLSVAYDSEKEPLRQDRRLFNGIDPGTYYTVYGDASLQGNDAASREKLYLRLEKDQFVALFGDYYTSVGGTALANYDRALTGFKSEYHDDGIDVLLFASENEQAFARDEMQGKSITGPYQLSRKNILLNSEQVTIQTRDRFHTERILTTRSLSRHLDYDIDYQRGAIVFRDPVWTVDYDLNPNFIVVNYETFELGNKSVSDYGGRVSKAVAEKVEVGATYLKEGRREGDGTASAVDVNVDLQKNTRMHAEVAQSSIGQADEKSIAQAFVANIEHRGQIWSGKVYLHEVESGFGVSQLLGVDNGTRKLGAQLAVRPLPAWQLNGESYQTTDLVTEAEREVTEAKGQYSYGPNNLRLGGRVARDEAGNGTLTESQQMLAGYSRRLLNNRLTLRVDREQSLGAAENIDFPNVTRLGADYLLSERATLFSEHEISDGDERDTEFSRVGLKTLPWQGGEVISTVRQMHDGEGVNTQADLGLRQKWLLNEYWSIDFGAERSEVVSSTTRTSIPASMPRAYGGTGEYTSASIGASYTRDDWSWHARTEVRDGETDDLWGIATSVQTNPTRELSTLSALTVTAGDSVVGTRSRNESLRLDMAYRPLLTRWTVLNRLEWISEFSRNEDFEFENWRIYNLTNANYRVNNKWQLSMQYGLKRVQEDIEHQQLVSTVDLVGGEARYNLTSKWDIGAHTSTLHSWRTHQYDSAYGLSFGHNFVENVWVSVGYNFTGFRDKDFSRANYTSEGVFMKFRVKFDQVSLREAIKWVN